MQSCAPGNEVLFNLTHSLFMKIQYDHNLVATRCPALISCTSTD